MQQEKLFIELSKGNKRVLDEIYNRYHQKIFGFALSYLKNEDDAYDIVQEVFINLWNSRSSLKKDTRIEPFIFTATKNAVISLFRKRATEQRYLEYLGSTVVSNNMGTNEQIDYNFLEEQYESLISQMPEKRKEIFILSRKKGLTNKDIASKLGISEKTVENQLTKALAFLKEHFSADGFLGLLFFYLFIT
ncbi:RNA polymerase sigma-70 factor [Anaerophaga thermohalophila]|jgi:RNA polymerase sigma-70 factor (ECF subfamily)|uniref:RNA polymerase sigma-70 factor n=1 Tax=Anaerophaga thermohalophila TaxID=177400 RepID=UPI0002F1B366|nr:RNA polymerase sigma-70 factor [Anaerophaga thermohalophila]